MQKPGNAITLCKLRTRAFGNCLEVNCARNGLAMGHGGRNFFGTETKIEVRLGVLQSDNAVLTSNMISVSLTQDFAIKTLSSNMLPVGALNKSEAACS